MIYSDQVILNPHVNVSELAEDVAIRERLRLGLGDQPIPNIRSLLETEVGVRIFYGPASVRHTDAVYANPTAAFLLHD
jgi:hypothetical protein